jgi:hypothetical protein
MRTQKEIQGEIKKLEEMKPRVRRFSGFCDDHHAAIDAQLEVLNCEVEGEDFEDQIDSGNWTEHDRDNAQRALDWMERTTDDPAPSEEWTELLVD